MWNCCNQLIVAIRETPKTLSLEWQDATWGKMGKPNNRYDSCPREASERSVVLNPVTRQNYFVRKPEQGQQGQARA
eukprot:jgi/Mesen1/6289/ME000324S05324